MKKSAATISIPFTDLNDIVKFCNQIGHGQSGNVQSDPDWDQKPVFKTVHTILVAATTISIKLLVADCQSPLCWMSQFSPLCWMLFCWVSLCWLLWRPLGKLKAMLFPSFESRVKINPRPRPSLKVIASSGNAVGRTIDYWSQA